MREIRTKKERAQAYRCGLLVLLAAMLGVQAAAAQERVPAQAMPCSQLTGLIQARGAAVLSTGAYTYERVVRDQGFCETETMAVPVFVPSADNRQCFAGYSCRQTNRGENRSD